MARLASVLVVLAIVSLAAADRPVFADDPPGQEGGGASPFTKSDSNVSQLLQDSVKEFRETGALRSATQRDFSTRESSTGTKDSTAGAESRARGESPSSGKPDDLVRFDAGGNVQVYIYLKDTDEAALRQVRDAVARVDIEHEESGIVQAWVAPEDLETLAALDVVQRITPPDYAFTKIGSTLTEGDAIHRANLVRAFAGLTGKGVKVGVISNGVDAWRTARSRGDLPSSIEVNPNIDGEGHEGTALLEIVHDLAPEAELAFSPADSSLEMAKAILWLANDAFEGEGADVIVDDLGYFREPFFEDGIVAQAAADAVAGGVVFASAAGNSAREHYEGDFVNAGDGFHAFDGDSDTSMRLRTPFGGVLVVLQWNDEYGASGNDYDLYVCPAGLRPTTFNLLNDICDRSTSLQDGDDLPLEIAALFGEGEVDVYIEKYDDTAADKRLEMFTFDGYPQEYGVREGGIVHHVAVPGVLAVGAFDEDDPGNDDIQSFSEQGPSRIYFPSVETRMKPDVVASDGVSVSGSGGFPSHFFGTSAAAPHVAGIAALLIEAQRRADPSMTKKQVADAVTQAIRDSAIDLGPAGHDVEFGYGRADALAAVESIGQLSVTTFTVDSTGDGADSDTTDGVCDDGNGECTLRAAIEEANEAERSTIKFDISGSGTQTIQPASALPTIAKTVFIDGFSQPGAGSGTFLIQLDGTNAGATADGLTISGEESKVRGLVINRFDGNGVVLEGSGGKQVIEENRIGTGVSGAADMGNGLAGISIAGAPGVVLRNNLISGNDSHGISISGSAAKATSIVDNLIGTNATGALGLANGVAGIHVEDAPEAAIASNVISGNDSHGVHLTGSRTEEVQIAENHIGTNDNGDSIPNAGSGVYIGDKANDNEVEGNVIAHNTGDGVTVVSSAARRNTVRWNSIHSNGGLGIDLGDDEVTGNDDEDRDSGPNNLQNFPTLTAAGLSSDAGSVAFTLDASKGERYIVDFYASNSCDALRNGEGREWFGYALLAPTASGQLSFLVDSFRGTLNQYSAPSGTQIIATVTYDGNTSEFSPCIQSIPLPRLNLSEESLKVTEGGVTSTTYTVRLASNPSSDATVALTIEGDEVVTVWPETLTFTTGNWFNAQTVTVTAVSDADPEDEPTVVSHRVIIDRKRYGAEWLPVEVLDDDFPAFSLTDDGTLLQEAFFLLVEGVDTFIYYPVVLTEEPPGDVRIKVYSSNSSVLKILSSSLTFTKDNYDTAQRVRLEVKTDSDAEDELVTIYHETNIGGHDYVLARSRFLIIDTALPPFTFSEEEISVNEGETARYTVVPAFEPLRNVTVKPVSSDPEAVTVSPSSLTFTVGANGNWQSPQTITVTGVGDDDEFNDVADIVHLAVHRGKDYEIGFVEVTVNDGNRAPFFEERLETSRSVPENSTQGTKVGEPVVATDLNGDVLTYGIEHEDDERFGIDRNTGQISVGPGLHLNFEADDSYRVKVTATDPGGLSDTIEVEILVTDVNEPPEVTGDDSVEFREGSTGTVERFRATDPEEDSFVWSVEGADGVYFSIDDRGYLSFNDPPDFEVKADANGDNVYEPVIVATDTEGNAGYLNPNVTVTDLNEPPTVSGRTEISVNENDENFGESYTATDPEDPSLEITRWSVTGTDRGDFEIDEDGELSFRKTPDYERPEDSNRDNEYRVTVRASDGRHYGTLDVVVTVSPQNEAPEIAGNSKTFISYQENRTSALYTYRATDPEQGTVVWSLSGADGGMFSISETGALTFNSSPDYENPEDVDRDNEYEVTVQARDAAFNTATLNVTVTVGDVNEGPEVTGTSTFTISENGELVGASYSATDPEDPGAQITRWSLTGTDSGDFEINEDGELSFRNRPDYEKPADSNRDNEYRVTVRASDGRYYGTLDVVVTVTAQNEAPEIAGNSKTEFSHRENGTSILYTFRATDPEKGDISWFVRGTDGGDFAIYKGMLTFRRLRDYEDAGDSDRDNEYLVTVVAADREGVEGTLDVTVTVTDENEGPEITGTRTFTITENQELVGASYTARDPEDPGGQITRWSVTGTDGGDFAIDEAGELSFRNTPDYERPVDHNRDNEYRVTVRASDGRHYGALDVTVTVSGENEAPEIASNSKTEINYRENGTSGLYTYRASDPEKEEISWTVRGADGNLFEMSESGALEFRTPPDHENAADTGGDNEYVVTVVAGDQGGLEGTLEVRVTVTDENEGPEITGTRTFTIRENQELVGASYRGRDPEDPSLEITRWSVTGTDRGDFEIDEDGELSFRKTPDYEKPADSNKDNEYRVTVRASDGRHYGTLNVVVTVSDENEAPEIASNSKTEINYRENGTSGLYTYRASDPEKEEISWTVRGADGNLFEMSESGALEFRTPPDHENAADTGGDNEYVVTVVAGDQGGLEGTLEVRVTVTDENEGPEITGTRTFTIRENQELVGASYRGRDPEDPSLEITRWSVTGTDRGDFEIDEDGELSFRKTPDYEKPADSNKDNEYRVTVRASDGRHYGTLNVVVTVSDENEAPEIASNSKTEISYRENGTSGLYTYRASDPEKEEISWTVRGTDGNLFEMSESGALEFRTPPDYENAGDTDRDNEYVVTVVASDERGLEGALEVMVTVTDQNEGPEITGTTTFSITENGELVGASYRGRDPEDPSLEITRWSVTGTDGGDFAIDEDGELSFRKTPDYEKPADSNKDNEYRVTVRASDGRHYGTLDVVVTVSGENEAPEIASNSKTEINYRENGTSGLYTYRASDPEKEEIRWTVRGADGNLFEMSESGALEFRTPPDYENAADTGGDNEYVVTVVAGDQGGLEGTLEVIVTVTDENEGPEITGTTTFSITENGELVGASYRGRDPEDPSLEITRWSVTGTDGGDFAIDEDGELSFRKTPDYEKPADSNKDNEYRVTVRASDGRHYGTLDVVVTVSGENEAPEIASNSKTEINYRENGTSGLYTYRASDPEKEEIRWTVRGADGNLFEMSESGALEFRTPPDYENAADTGGDNEYVVTVVAGDQGGLEGTLEVIVTVTDENEGPEITGTTTFSITENGELVGASYRGRDPEDPSLEITRWSVTGTDGGDFEIDEDGELSFRKTPDYEKPADSNKDNEYRVTVRASDGRNYGTLDVVVTVSGENEAPEIASNSKTEISYRENGTSGLYTYRASDPEKEEISWTVRGADGNLFEMSESGALEFRTPPDYENAADTGGDNEYVVTVVAGDQGGLEGTLEVIVTVTDENEGPEITGTRTFTIRENGELVGASYRGRDPEDPSLEITRWSVTGTDGGDFEIDEDGELSFRKTPDYEKPADSNKDNEYRVTVRASDGRHYGTLNVVVTVSDENEAPEIASNSKTEISYRENGTSGLYTYRASDPEKEEISWTVRGADGNLFEMSESGALEFRTPPDYENAGDTDRDNEYVVTVVASDERGLEGALEVMVTVTDQNEGPEITGTTTFSITENGELVGASYRGRDPEDPSLEITRWSVTGTDGGDFAIDEDGELSFRKTPDYEKPADSNKDNEYRVTVRASDGRHYGTLDVVVTVSGENEAPEIASNSKTEINYRENGTSGLYTYRASDPEKEEIRWTVRGADGNLFEMSESGALEFRTPPDYENAADTGGDNEYVVTVVAGDQGGLEGTLEVIVTVTDENEGPEITGTRTFTIRENQELVGASYTATDPEDPSLEITRWSVTGTDRGDFEIDEDGELSFRKTPDYEKPADSNKDNEYRVTVRASDGRHYGTLNVVVTVSDENEAPEIASNSKTEISYRENGTSGLYTYRASDPEKEEISWTVRGADGNLFEMSESGALEFRTPPDYENAADTGGDNEYVVTVVAGDQGGLEGTLEVIVTVTDENEGPEITGTTTFSITENGELVGASYRGRDPEDPSLEITRWSVTGTDGGDFEIDEDGELSFRKTPDYEKPADSNKDNEYVVTVRASDGRHYGALDVVVTVSGENEAPEIASNSKTEINYRENGTSGLYTYRASDPEKEEISWTVRGADGNLFEMSESGALEFRTPPDYENAGDTDRDNEYVVTVVASDERGLEGTLEVRVTVTDQNEGPEITGTTTFSITENGELVGASYRGRDPEDPSLEITRWSVTGTDRGDFEIDEDGELSFRKTPDYEKPADSNKDNEYRVTVRASDGRHYGTLDVVVTVLAVNEAPEISGNDSITYEENDTDSVGTYRATDPEEETVTWGLSGADSSVFSISDTGVLTFNSSPDYDNPGDSGGDNVYEVTVEARDDGSNTAGLDVTVTVTNVTD